MKFCLDEGATRFRVAAYGEGGYRIADQWLAGPCLLAPDRLWADWTPRGAPTLLAPEDLEAAIAEWPPEVLLLGTGQQQVLPDPSLVVAMAARRIAVEAMASPPACRTYNLLAGDGRRVMLALWPVT